MTRPTSRPAHRAHRSNRHARPSATGRARIPALDGIRALALVLIMTFHFGVSWLPGGYLGVDMFFVLSGYLITGLLIGEYRRSHRIVLSAFWLRRARRLLPALVLVLVAVTLMVRFAEPAGLYPGFRMNALSAEFYFSNWWQIATSSNYFVATGAVSPLTHTWSLAVEEQFYLVWPLVAVAVLHLSRSLVRGVRVLALISLAGAAASVAEMAVLYGPSVNTTRLYFGTDTHAEAILIGAALACVLTLVQLRRGQEGMAPPARSVLACTALFAVGVLGIAGIVTLSVTMDGTSAFAYRGGLALGSLCAAAIILGVVCVQNGAVARLLSLGPLVWIGTVSYGAYLWHYPVFVYLDGARTGLTDFALLVVRAAVTFAIAAASYYILERPILERTYWRTLRAAVPAVAVVAGTAALVLAGTAAEASANPSAPLPSTQATAAGQHLVPVLLEGDSTALTLGPAIVNEAAALHVGIQLIDDGVEGCGIAEGTELVDSGVIHQVSIQCNTSAPATQQWPALLQGEVAKYRPKVVVLLAGRWEVHDWINSDGSETNITDPTFAAYVKQQLQRFVAIASSQGAHVILMTAPYYDSGELPDGQPKPEDNPGRVDVYNRLVRQVAAATAATGLIDLNPIVCPGGRYTQSIGNIVVRAPDGVHFPYVVVDGAPGVTADSPDQFNRFASWIGPKLLPPIEEAAGIMPSGSIAPGASAHPSSTTRGATARAAVSGTARR